MADSIDSSFREQQRMGDRVSLKSMLIQVCINLGFIIFVLLLFSWLRPRHALIYAPKAKLSKSDIRRPITLGPGWFDWIKPVFEIEDDALLEIVGFDAYIFIYFTRILRRLVIILTLISILIFIPVNIVATYTTGDWPPVGLEFLSISAMNYQYGKQSRIPNLQWYWSPTIATWMFSAIISYQMIHSSKHFIMFRQRYYIKREETTKLKLPSMSQIELLQHQKQELISRTLLVHFQKATTKQPPRQQNSKQHLIPNENFKKIVDLNSSSPCQQVLVGKYNKKVESLIHDYNCIIKALEKEVNHYLCRVNEQQDYRSCGIIGGSTAAKNTINRPQIRLNWRSKNIDAINYYTGRALSLDASIKRNRLKLQNDNFGWVIYPNKSTAHKAYLSIEKSLKDNIGSTSTLTKNGQHCERIRLAPHPDDIVWSNMNIDKHTGQLKRWFGYGLFFSIIFAYSVPVATLAVSSNMVNFIRLFPKSAQVIYKNQLLMGLIQSYLTPCLMVLMCVGLFDLLRFVSRQQAYKTETILQQKILSKFYTFFVVNNLFIFTLVSIMLGILGQITALTLVGTSRSKSLSQYIVQIAKNMTDVSAFWINYVCIRSVGVIFGLLQIAPLIWIILFRGKGYLLQYTPRQLNQAIGAPPFFDFAKNYGLVISFFTAALVYSVTAPIVLPFALIYFGLATTTFKYKLMYIYITKVETHGKIWPLLYCIVMISLFVFQVMMILILSLKTGMYQIYVLIPLPIITAVVSVGYSRYLWKHNTLKTWIELKNSIRLAEAPPPPSSSNGSSTCSNNNDIELIEISAAENQQETTATTNSQEEEDSLIRDARLINCIYKDPALFDPLWKPMLFNNVKNLVPDVYKDHPQRERILKTLYSPDDEKQQYSTCHQKVITPAPIVIAKQKEEHRIEETILLSSPLSAINEKLQVKEQLKKEMIMYPPTPHHHGGDATYYHYYYQEQEDQGSSSQQPMHFITEPILGDDICSSPTAPPLDMYHHQPQQQEEAIIFHQQPPPPDYADVVSPRINMIHRLEPQQKQPPIQRRHSVS